LLAGSPAVGVNGIGKKLFACPAFSFQQNGAARWGGLADVVENFNERRPPRY